jgi:acetyltransferase-like isoleucine patch superfamily enzyme
MKNLFKKIVRKLILLIRYNPYNYSIKLRNLFYKFLFKNSGKNFNILDGVIINFPENVSIGNNVSIHQFCCFDSQDDITIGNNVSIGNSVKFVTSSHNFFHRDILIKNLGVSI